MTDDELPWLTDLVDEVSARFGPPKVKVPRESRRMRTELGVCYRRCWAWFPGNVNHHLAVDRYLDRVPGWYVWAGSHAGTFVGAWCAEPAADKVRAVLVLAGFLVGDHAASRELLGRCVRSELEFVDAAGGAS